MGEKKSLIRRVWQVADFLIPYIGIFGWIIYRHFTVGITEYVRPVELIIVSLLIASMAKPRMK
ncbi:MAG: hypothetical protein WC445_01960 [Patescibacteria group bacterium]